MKIENLRLETKSERTRTVARVTWEDCNRPAMDVFFETHAQFADGLSTDPDAFLAACSIAAMRHGEKRVLVDGRVCPHLLAGLQTAMALLRYWYPSRQPPKIEGKPRSEALAKPSGGRAAFFMSGGVDSLATLRTNHLNYPAGHPCFARDGILIYGLEIEQPAIFEHVLETMLAFSQKAGFTLLPVYTNVRYLDDDWVFWIDEFEASVLSSVAHALNRRLSTAFIASSFDYPWLHAHGSHPMLDPNYSSYDLRIHHDAVALSRFEKVKILSDWQPALESLRVCNKTELYRAGVLNCGKCEKCLRTLAALLILGRLESAKVFDQREVTSDLIRANVYLTKTDFPFWEELLPHLRRMGRNDLVSAIEFRMKEYWGEWGLKGRIKALDRKYLQGSLRRLARSMSSARIPSNGGH